jgi:NAD(P)H-dependent FMN reductase
MTTLLGISGSLRRGSFNTSLLRAAAGLMPAGSTLETATLHGIPLYDGDLEAESGLPDAVRALKDRIAAADGLVIVTPEYNNSMPGVLKNALDWLSRPASDIGRVFGNRHVAIMGATPGPGGTLMSQTAWLPVLRALGTRAWFGPRMLVSGAGKVFDAEGALTDEKVRGQLQGFLSGFVEVIHPSK